MYEKYCSPFDITRRVRFRSISAKYFNTHIHPCKTNSELHALTICIIHIKKEQKKTKIEKRTAAAIGNFSNEHVRVYAYDRNVCIDI